MSETLAKPEQPHRETPQRWFPLRFDLVKQQEFKKLVFRQKVILLDIYYRLSEHLGLYELGRRPNPYYVEGDGKWARRLRVSVDTFRDARQQMGRDITGKTQNHGLGWFDYRPGHGDRNGNLYATEYHGARFARIKKGEGIQCAALDRHTWAVLIGEMKNKEDPLAHVDLAVYLAVAYLWKLCGGPIPGKRGILLYKGEIEDLTGVKIGPFMKSLSRLSRIMTHSGDGTAGLFDFRMSKQAKKWSVEISGWRAIPDQKDKPHGNPSM